LIQPGFHGGMRKALRAAVKAGAHVGNDVVGLQGQIGQHVLHRRQAAAAGVNQNNLVAAREYPVIQGRALFFRAAQESPVQIGCEDGFLHFNSFIRVARKQIKASR
jgi:hypothetical protein